MFNKNILYTLIGLNLISGNCILNAQSTTKRTYSLEQDKIETVRNPWISMPTPASIGFSTQSEGNQVSLGLDHQNGDYKLAGQAGQKNALLFDASMFQKVGETFRFYGHFGLNYSHQNERAYYDLIFPTENAYVMGANRKGKYNQYIYDLNFKVATTDLNGWNFGMGIDYKAADLSRILDPRPRVLAAHYQLTPAVTYKLNESNRLGLSAYYRFEKQRMTGITQVNDDTNYKYYFSTGLDNAYINVDFGGFFRIYSDHIVGGDLQYGLTSSDWTWTTSLGISHHDLEMTGSQKRIPGTYSQDIFRATSKVTWQRPHMLHILGVNGSYQDGSNTAFIQDFVQITDEYGHVSEKWVTEYKNKTYTHNNYDLAASYDLYIGNIEAKDYSMKFGVSGSMKHFERKYLLPTSKHEMTNATADAYYGLRLYNKKQHKVWMTLGGGIVTPLDQQMLLVNNNDYAGLVLRANEVYYNLSAYNYKVDVNYSFPISLGTSELIGYIQAMYKQTNSENDDFDYMHASITVGILNF